MTVYILKEPDGTIVAVYDELSLAEARIWELTIETVNEMRLDPEDSGYATAHLPRLIESIRNGFIIERMEVISRG
jgi:hypothetical protein